MKIGDKLYCKNDINLIDTKYKVLNTLFKIKNFYSIGKIAKKHIMIQDDFGTWIPFSLIKELAKAEGSKFYIAVYYIWNLFYS